MFLNNMSIKTIINDLECKKINCNQSQQTFYRPEKNVMTKKKLYLFTKKFCVLNKKKN